MRAAPAAGAALLLLVLVLVCFLPVLDNGFVNYDDDKYVTANANLDAGAAHIARWAFTGFTASNWHPLTWLSHALDVALFGRVPRWHHLVSLLLHVANTLALFLLLRRLTGAVWSSAFAAGVFGVHPLHVESVAWVAERKDLLAGLCLWLALLAYRRYLARKSAPRYLAVLLLHGLGLMAKPMLVTLPAVLLLLDFWPLGRLRPGAASGGGAGGREPPARVLAEKLPFLALSVASVAVTLVAQARGGAMKSLEEYPLAQRAGNALVSLARYLDKALWPRDLAVFYPHPGAALGTAAVLAAAAALVAVTLMAVRGARSRPHLAAGWLWYLVTLSPVLGVVQVGAQAMADRYMYIPLAGPAIAAAWWLAAAVRRSRHGEALAAAACTAILLVLGAQARSQVGVWRSSVTLFEHALVATRENYVAHDNLAVALAEAGRTREALLHALQAQRIRPDREPGRYLDLARALMGQRLYPEAVEALGIAQRMLPGDDQVRQLMVVARATALRHAPAGPPVSPAPPGR
ncbi:MAG TPA: hypothetical protein VI078_13450 [bacterium]